MTKLLNAILLLLFVASACHAQAKITTPEVRHDELLKSSITFLSGLGLTDKSSGLPLEGFIKSPADKFLCKIASKDVTLIVELSKFGKGPCSLVRVVTGKQVDVSELKSFTQTVSVMLGEKSHESLKELVDNVYDVFTRVRKSDSNKKSFASDLFKLPSDPFTQYQFTITETGKKADDPKSSFSIGFTWEALTEEAAAKAELKKEERLLNLVAWNIESGGNDPAVIAKQLKDGCKSRFANCR